MKTTNRNGKKIQFWVSDEEYEKLSNLAVANSWNMSELVRSLIYKQLGINGANDGVDFIRRQIREELKVISKANTERIIKIIIKAAMIEISTFFYVKAVLKLTDPALEEELWEQSRKETAAYLGMRNSRAAEQAYRDFTENYSIDYDDVSDEIKPE